MSGLASDGPARKALIEMEVPVEDVKRWADVLLAVGACSSQIDPGAIHVIGESVDKLSARLTGLWEHGMRAAGCEP